MSQFLEATMLICFGLSWPLTVIKNIKAKTAKSMSLAFILLIITGYVAGIAAKFINQTFNYVLLVYFFNLAVVSINLIVYFINRRYDTVQLAINNAETAECENYTAKEKIFNEANKIAYGGGSVLFGSSYFTDFPINELANSCGIDEKIYNRSVYGMNVETAEEFAVKCVVPLNPHKIFVNIGEIEARENNVTEETLNRFCEKYKALINLLKERTNSEIYLVSIISETTAAVKLNDQLKKLADEAALPYIDLANVADNSDSHLKAFEKMKFYLRSRHISYADAMAAI